MTEQLHTITITTESIELCKLLKIADLVAGGGEAKIVITQGYVLVNEQVEYQKRKKIKAGDIIEFNGERIIVAVQLAGSKNRINSSRTVQNQSKNLTKTSKTSKTKNSASSDEPTSHPQKRKPISF